MEKTQKANSFLDSKSPIDPNAPPPPYILYYELAAPLPTLPMEILRYLEINEKGGLVCREEPILKRQRGVFSTLLKQFMYNVSHGLGMSHLSLPVRIFEPRSTIQRVVDLFSHGPRFLAAAAAESEPLARIKHVISFAIGGIYLCTG